MKELILYELNEGPTRVSIKILDFDEKIKVDGYDVGQSVRDVFGYSDYEYSMEVNKRELSSLLEDNESYFDLFNPYVGESKCFSMIKLFFDDNGITYKYNSWRSGG